MTKFNTKTTLLSLAVLVLLSSCGKSKELNTPAAAKPAMPQVAAPPMNTLGTQPSNTIPDSSVNNNPNNEEDDVNDDAHASHQKNTPILDSLPTPRTAVHISAHSSRQSMTSETDKPVTSLSNPTSSGVSPAKPILRRSFNRIQRGNQPLTDLEIAVKNLECDTKDGNLDYKDCYLGELESLIL